jgi:hypothetical protein
MRTLVFTLLLTLPVVAQKPMTFHVAGVDITADLGRWQVQEGTARMPDGFVRLGFFSNGPHNLSIFVGNIPRGARDLDTLCKGNLRKWSSADGLTMVDPKGFAGKEACLFTFTVANFQRSIYVEMIAEEQWLEFHYSNVTERDALASGRKVLEAIIGSMRIVRYEPKQEAPTGDIKDEEVARVEQFLKCAPGSSDIICRSLVEFRAGTVPKLSAELVGLPGLAIGGSFEKGEQPEYRAGALTLSTDGALFLTIDPKGKDGKAAGDLVKLMRAGKPIPETNSAVVFARSRKKVEPVSVVERSVTFAGDQDLFMRATPEGFVLFQRTDGAGFLLAVFPVAH